MVKRLDDLEFTGRRPPESLPILLRSCLGDRVTASPDNARRPNEVCLASQSWYPTPSAIRSPRIWSPTRRARCDGRIPACSIARDNALATFVSMVERRSGSTP